MIKLNLYNETKDILRKYNISANKKLGQNFLIDEEAFVTGSDTCIQFVLDNMNGIDMEEVEKSDERVKK